MTGWNVIFSGPDTGTAKEETAWADDTVAGQGSLPGAEKNPHSAIFFFLSNYALWSLLEKLKNGLHAINGKRRK